MKAHLKENTPLPVHLFINLTENEKVTFLGEILSLETSNVLLVMHLEKILYTISNHIYSKECPKQIRDELKELQKWIILRLKQDKEDLLKAFVKRIVYSKTQLFNDIETYLTSEVINEYIKRS